MYTHLAPLYDHFVNWQARLAFEMPFLQQQIRGLGKDPTKVTILDTACGTGQHAIALAAEGHKVSACDIAPAMVAIAQANAEAAFQKVDFKTVGFGKIAQAYKPQSFDAVFCLGNSIPHVENEHELIETLEDFKVLLVREGLLLLQLRNFARVLANQERWMEPQFFVEGSDKYLFQRFYDFEPGGKIQFNMVTLARKKGGNWRSEVNSSMLLPLMAASLENALAETGFNRIQKFGSMDGSPYDAALSGDLIITARLEA